MEQIWFASSGGEKARKYKNRDNSVSTLETMEEGHSNAKWAAKLGQGCRRAILPQKRGWVAPSWEQAQWLHANRRNYSEKTVLSLSCPQWTSYKCSCLKFIQVKSESSAKDPLIPFRGGEQGWRDCSSLKGERAWKSTASHLEHHVACEQTEAWREANRAML